ncbi:hypothetical protein GOP47_0018337, partial [Adiantum capillus-veneris]
EMTSKVFYLSGRSKYLVHSPVCKIKVSKIYFFCWENCIHLYYIVRPAAFGSLSLSLSLPLYRVQKGLFLFWTLAFKSQIATRVKGSPFRHIMLVDITGEWILGVAKNTKPESFSPWPLTSSLRAKGNDKRLCKGGTLASIINGTRNL